MKREKTTWEPTAKTQELSKFLYRAPEPIHIIPFILIFSVIFGLLIDPSAQGITYGILQHYATLLVTRITENASDTYGQFALVLGLVTWLGFIAIATLMAAELNVSIVRRRERLRPVPAVA